MENEDKSLKEEASFTEEKKDSFKIGKFFVYIIILIALALGISELYSYFNANNLSINKNVKANTEGLADIYFMPFEGFDIGLANGLAKKLSDELKLNIKVSKPLTIPENAVLDYRSQYWAGKLANVVDFTAGKVLDVKGKTIYIGLCQGSICDPTENLPYVFTALFPFGVSVVGTEEMRENVSEKRYNMRLYKVIKRTIGLMHYKYPRSENIKSVLFSPMMTMYDLDSIGTHFDSELK